MTHHGGPALFDHKPGHVYLVRGVFGVWSRGIDALALRLRYRGYKTTVLTNGYWKGAVEFLTYARLVGDRQPIILIGHSSGGADALRMAAELDRRRIPTELLVVLDTVGAPRVPAGVLRAYNMYLADGLPHGDRLAPAKGFSGRLDNVEVRRHLPGVPGWSIDHFNIDDLKGVHETVARQLEKVHAQQRARRQTAAGPRGSW